MKIPEYRQKIRDEFYKGIDRKTGWGKNEIKKEFEEAGEVVILEMLEEVERSHKGRMEDEK